MNIDFDSKILLNDKKYVLLFGGSGYEREVSVAGACEFLKCAENIGLDFLPIYINSSGDFYIFLGKADDVLKIERNKSRKMLIPTSPVRLSGKGGFLLDGVVISPKFVFPLLHGDYGEDGVIQGLLSSLGINFFGADNFTGAIASDKVYSKIIARSAGVPTLPEIVISAETNYEDILCEIDKEFGFPVFVKPTRLGSSIGASLAKSKQQFSKSLKKAFSVAKRIMIEPALLDKRELECAYYNVRERKIITPPAEVSLSGSFYDFNLKYKSVDGIRLIPKADVDESIKAKIVDYTNKLSKAFAARHIARFDYFLLPDGSVYFNEVNTMPGMTSSSLYSVMLGGEGLNFTDFILNVKGAFD